MSLSCAERTYVAKSILLQVGCRSNKPTRIWPPCVLKRGQISSRDRGLATFAAESQSCGERAKTMHRAWLIALGILVLSPRRADLPPRRWRVAGPLDLRSDGKGSIDRREWPLRGYRWGACREQRRAPRRSAALWRRNPRSSVWRWGRRAPAPSCTCRP